MPTMGEYQKQDGVRDLPPKARRCFAGALVFEEKGRHDKAADYLDKAIKHEANEE